MKLLLCVLILTISSGSVGATSSCSIENSQKLLNLVAKFIGETGADSNKLDKVILKSPDAKEIRRQFEEIKRNSKAGSAAEEAMAFAKAHPECDPEGNFRIARAYN